MVSKAKLIFWWSRWNWLFYKIQKINEEIDQ